MSDDARKEGKRERQSVSGGTMVLCRPCPYKTLAFCTMQSYRSVLFHFFLPPTVDVCLGPKARVDSSTTFEMIPVQ